MTTTATPTVDDEPSETFRVSTLPTAELTGELIAMSRRMAHDTARFLVLVGEIDQRDAWETFGSLSCAAWLADTCDLDIGTARTQVRVARAMRKHRSLADALADGRISYTKARALVPYLRDENVDDLLDLAHRHAARDLGAAIAAWSRRYEGDRERDERHHRERRLSWRTDGDGMVVITARLPPAVAAEITRAIDRVVMTAGRSARDASADASPGSHSGEHVPGAPASDGSESDGSGSAGADSATSASDDPARERPNEPAHQHAHDGIGDERGEAAASGNGGPASADASTTGPSLAQQRADALGVLARTWPAGAADSRSHASPEGRNGPAHEIVLHVRGDLNTLADGTPIPDHAVAKHLPDAFVSLLVTDMRRRPIDASPRRRVPTRRQKRVVDERHPTCAHPGCEARALLQYDHIRPHALGGPTTVDNLQRLCGPHNRARNESMAGGRADAGADAGAGAGAGAGGGSTSSDPAA